MPRFVVLEHRWRGVHFDLMLERGGALATWAVDAPIAPGAALPARALPDHRLAYLDYEGPVSGDRGTVRAVARGEYDTLSWSDDVVLVALRSPQLSGPARLTRGVGGAWSFLFRPGNVD